MHNPINPKLLRLYNERSERWKFQHWDSPYGSDVVYYFIVDKQNVLIDWQVTVYDFIFNPKWEFAKLIFGDDYPDVYMIHFFASPIIATAFQFVKLIPVVHHPLPVLPVSNPRLASIAK